MYTSSKDLLQCIVEIGMRSKFRILRVLTCRCGNFSQSDFFSNPEPSVRKTKCSYSRATMHLRCMPFLSEDLGSIWGFGQVQRARSWVSNY